MTSGRKRNAIWLEFEELVNKNRKGKRAKCKKCGNEMEGQIQRMKSHFDKCSKNQDQDVVILPESQSEPNGEFCFVIELTLIFTHSLINLLYGLIPQILNLNLQLREAVLQRLLPFTRSFTPYQRRPSTPSQFSRSPLL